MKKSGRIFIYLLLFLASFVLAVGSYAGSVSIVATVNGNPITDVDITYRTRIMPPALNNRENAKNAIIEDFLKLEHARDMRIEPTEKEVEEITREHKNNPQAKLHASATLAWQMIIMRTIVPTIAVSEEDIRQEMVDLERDRGLPWNMTFIRLINIQKSSYEKLTKPESCRDAEAMARKLGGAPQKITALHYELAPEIRERFMGLGDLEWSALEDRQVFLICERTKTKEWGQLDDIIKQNAVYKRALFQADQLLKQLRRRATIL